MVGESRNYDRCVFIKDGRTTVFEPRDLEEVGILAYGFGGRIFVRNIDENYFVELIEEGHLTLYQKGNLYYLNKGSDSAQINTKEEFLVDGYGDKVYKENNVWRFKLKVLTEDCLDNYNYERLAFSGKSIRKVVREYNDCSSASQATFRTRQRQVSDFTIYGGIAYSLLNFKDIQSSQFPWLESLELDDDKFGYSLSVGVSSYTNLFFLRVNADLVLGAEVQYLHSSSGQTIRNEPIVNEYSFSSDRLFATMPLGARFKLGSTGGAEFFLETLFLGNFLVYSKVKIDDLRYRTDLDVSSEIIYADVLEEETFFTGYRIAFTYAGIPANQRLALTAHFTRLTEPITTGNISSAGLQISMKL